MSEINVWNNVSVAAQTVLATAKTISAITKASPGVVSSTAHGYNNGDIVLLRVTGMRQLEYMIARVAASTTDAFSLEDVDTTDFGTFVSGTAQKLTFGAEAATFQDVNSTGGEDQPIPTNTIHIDFDREIPGNKTALSYAFGSQWIPDDPCLLALFAASRTKKVLGMRITFATGDVVYFAAYPSVSMAPTGSSGQVVTTPVSFKLAGPLNFYAGS